MESLKLRMGLASVVAFLMSTYYSIQEFRYAAWGRTVQGRVVEMTRGAAPGGFGGRRVRDALYATVSFPNEQGATQTGSDEVGPGSTIGPGDPVEVQYVPGDEYAVRLAGNRDLTPVYVFLGTLAVMAAFVGMLIKEANEPVRRKPSKPPVARRV